MAGDIFLAERVMKMKIFASILLISAAMPMAVAGERPLILKILMPTRLDKYAETIRASVVDVYAYALVDTYHRSSMMKEETSYNYDPDTPLCDTKQLRQLSSKLLISGCRAMSYEPGTSCKDADGCIELNVHKDVQQDPELNALLQSAIRNPCRYIPVGPGIHWNGLSYPNFVTESLMNCPQGSPPYSTVFITYGQTRVELDMKIQEE